MPLPQPEGWEDRFLALERKVNDLFTSIQNRNGITSASAGLIFPSMGTPPTPVSGGHLYGQDGQPYWRASSGTISNLIPDPFPKALRTEIAANMTAGTAPASYDAAYLQRLRDDVVEVRRATNGQINNLRGADLSF